MKPQVTKIIIAPCEAAGGLWMWHVHFSDLTIHQSVCAWFDFMQCYQDCSRYVLEEFK